MEDYEVTGGRGGFAASPEADMIRQYEASCIYGIRRKIYARLVKLSHAARLFHDT
jgi:hypothetical protein